MLTKLAIHQVYTYYFAKNFWNSSSNRFFNDHNKTETQIK